MSETSYLQESPLSADQWMLLCRLNPAFFDITADLVADINALMEEDRPNRLFFLGVTPNDPQTLRLSFHMSMTG